MSYMLNILLYVDLFTPCQKARVTCFYAVNLASENIFGFVSAIFFESIMTKKELKRKRTDNVNKENIPQVEVLPAKRVSDEPPLKKVKKYF